MADRLSARRDGSRAAGPVEIADRSATALRFLPVRPRRASPVRRGAGGTAGRRSGRDRFHAPSRGPGSRGALAYGMAAGGLDRRSHRPADRRAALVRGRIVTGSRILALVVGCGACFAAPTPSFSAGEDPAAERVRAVILHSRQLGAHGMGYGERSLNEL